MDAIDVACRLGVGDEITDVAADAAR